MQPGERNGISLVCRRARCRRWPVSIGNADDRAALNRANKKRQQINPREEDTDDNGTRRMAAAAVGLRHFPTVVGRHASSEVLAAHAIQFFGLH